MISSKTVMLKIGRMWQCGREGIYFNNIFWVSVKIPHGLTWGQTQVSAVRGRLVAARSKTRITKDNESLQGLTTYQWANSSRRFGRSYSLHLQSQAVQILVTTRDKQQHLLPVRHHSDSISFAQDSHPLTKQQKMKNAERQNIEVTFARTSATMHIHCRGASRYPMLLHLVCNGLQWTPQLDRGTNPVLSSLWIGRSSLQQGDEKPY